MNWLESIEIDEIEVITATEETTEERNERFKITDLASMNWALRKLTALNKNLGEERLLADMEVQRIQKWYAKQVEANQNSANFLEGLIKEYATQQRVIDPKWKSKTPYGLVSFRKQQPKWEYDDESLKKYLVGSEWETDYTRTKVEPDKVKIKESQIFKVQDEKLINTATGEIVPGITVTNREELVTIKLEG